MSKILQVRRGTSDAHNKFTGMVGEISYDVDAKTLRVHDGETLGGFALARADQIPVQGEGVGPDGQFDITNVSDEFWGELIARFAPVSFTVVESPKIELNSSIPYTECILGEVNKIPAIINVMLECQSPDAGYAIGDMVYTFGVGDRVCPQPNAWIYYNQLRIRFMIANEQFWVNNKSTGVRTNVVPENWRLIFRVYC
jgi:hypothetical protein